jgi:hypothetical protein
MSDTESWQKGNDTYLAHTVALLRLRLQRLAPVQSSQVVAHAPVVAVPPVERRGIFGRRDAPVAPTPAPAVPALTIPLDDQINKAVEAMSAAEAIQPVPSLLALEQRLGLSRFERDVLLFCAAMEFDTRIAALCARAHDDPQKAFPTFALALTLFDEPLWEVLSPQRPLRYWRLLEINQNPTQPLTASPLRADERIVNYLKGLNYLDDRLSSFLSPMELEAGDADLAASQRKVVETILHRWQQAAEIGPLPVMQLLGSDPVSKQLVASHAAAQLDRFLYRLPVELFPSAPADLETLARLWQRESLLLPLALYLDAEELDATNADRFRALSRFLAHGNGMFFLAVRESVPRLARDQVALDIAKPTTTEQQSAWSGALGASAPDSPSELAAQFNLNLPNIRQLARLARTEADSAPESLPEKVWAVCCASERPRLDALAQRIDSKATWDDLVLPVTQMNLLHQLAAQVGRRSKVYSEWGFDRKMNRGFGISVLFAGESGCGKTMAAEVIANELCMNLYRIDLSAVVNKYIGETPKNLRRLFDAAEAGGTVLCFDECDALFGKRSEVKDSHDRYANIEISYLLQRIESYQGLAILATNMKSALDTAFLRRLRFIVDFPFPGVDNRRQIWEKIFLQADVARGLSTPPLDRLDYDRLARLNLSGGNILCIALNACFMAAELNAEVTMPLVLEAARGEFIKLGRHINEPDFRWTDPAPAAPKPVARIDEPVLV